MVLDAVACATSASAVVAAAAGGLAACRRPGKQVNAERGCHLCDDCKLVVDVLDPLRKEE